VYILASRPEGTLYLGVTSHLTGRLRQHGTGETGGFTARYGVRRLVYAEWYDDIRDALARERRLKKWRRAWKLDLIRSTNPRWDDLGDLLRASPPWGQNRMDSRVRGNDDLRELP